MKPIDVLCWQNAELDNVKAGGTYSVYCALKGYRDDHECIIKRRFKYL
jgi:hypothetical protein